MISRQLGDGAPLAVFGVVRGRVEEIVPLLRELATFAPDRVALGLSPDEMRSLGEHFVDAEAEPVVPLTSHETAEVVGLARYGEVRVPHPAFVEVLSWAHARGIPVDALDPSDERFADLFTDHIGYIELVRRTLKERRLSRQPPEPATAEEYALAWDRTLSSGRGSQRFLAAREAAAVSVLRSIRGAHAARTAVVVDRERFDRFLAALGVPPATSPTAGRRG